MQNIISDLRLCIERFVYDSNDYTLGRFYNALIYKNDTYVNEEFESYPNLKNGNYEFYRMLIILIMTSDYYEYAKYNNDSDEYIKFLDNPYINYDDIITCFIKDEKYALEVMTEYSDYGKAMECLLTTACIDHILKNKKLKKQLFRINPFIFLEYLERYQITDFEDEDIIEFYLNDIYAKIEKEVDDLDLDEDEEFIALSEEGFTINLTAYKNKKIAEDFVPAIVDKFSEIYSDDMYKVNESIQFMIYRILSSAIKDFDNLSELKNIYNLINDLSEPSDIVVGFVYDLDFADTILEYYRKSILYKFPPQEANFLFAPQVKTLKLLKKFNPYTESDDEYEDY